MRPLWLDLQRQMVRWAMVAAGQVGNGCRWSGWQRLPLAGMAMVAAGRDGNGCRWSGWQRLPLVGMATVAAGRDATLSSAELAPAERAAVMDTRLDRTSAPKAQTPYGSFLD
jgi:hypothetical protein